jgi:hypothetical protein
MEWVFNDGGRAEAGYKGRARDCSCRAIAIAFELPYQTVYDALNATNRATSKRHRPGQRKRRDSARTGVSMRVLHKFFKASGWAWVPTMGIGTGCKVHLRAEELPPGRLIVRVSKHLCAVIDGVLHDTHACDRDGTRCVYGYWKKV